MPQPAFPPTPISSTDLKSQENPNFAAMHSTFELPPPAMANASRRSSAATNSSASSCQPPTPKSNQVSQPKPSARRRSSAAQPNAAAKDTFTLPPPPTRSRKIIQMKPVEEPAPQPKTTEKASAPAPRQRKPPSANSVAGRKIARKTAHSLIERRRRSKMNEEFGVLKDMIPACTGEMHKLAILQASIDYIRYLEDCVAKLKVENSRTSSNTLPAATSSFSPRKSDPYDPESGSESPASNASDNDVEMTNSTSHTPTGPSPYLAHQPSNQYSQPHSPILLPPPQQSYPAPWQSRPQHPRHNSHSSAYSNSHSANTSPAFGPQSVGPAPHYAQSIHSTASSALPSPALGPMEQRHEDMDAATAATAALLALGGGWRDGRDSRRSSDEGRSGAEQGEKRPQGPGRSMSVLDLLSS